jgi:hypothetical protein
VLLMAKRPTPEMIAEGLTVPERLMVFCIASATIGKRGAASCWSGADRSGAAGSYVLTEQRCEVFEILIVRAATRG